MSQDPVRKVYITVYHPAKFGGHRHVADGDMIFLVVEGKNLHALLKTAITVYL